MKVLILGGSGLLGHKLVQILGEKFEVWTAIRGKLSEYGKFSIFSHRNTFENVRAENLYKLEKLVAKIKPDAVINAVGVTKHLSSERNICEIISVNSIFPHRLAALAKRFEFRLIHISTDCVFSGLKGCYVETDIPDARDLYGKSKNLGEVVGENCLTIRTSFIGREILTERGLVEWFLSQKGRVVEGYKNAVFSGFPTIILANVIGEIIEKHKNINGLYHISSEPISKYDLLVLLKRAYRVRVEIEASADLVIDRSLDSTKFRRQTGFEALSWEKMIEKMADDPTPYHKWKH